MKRSLTVGLLTTALLWSSVGASANHAWAGHWSSTGGAASVKLVDSVQSAWDTYLVGAAADWDLSSVVDVAVEPGKTSRSQRKGCKPLAGKVRVCNYTYGKNGWLGMAEIWVQDGHILYARVRANDTYFKTSTYNKPEWRSFVMCHETGHTLGLDHQDSNFDNANLATCLDYTNDPTTNQYPNTHDYDQLEAIYDHVDAAAVAASQSSASSRQSESQGHTRRGWSRPNCEVQQTGSVTKITWTYPAR